MKKQLIKAISGKTLSILITVFIFNSTLQKAHAFSDTLSKAKGAEIAYKGIKGEKLIFEDRYKNELSKPFQLIVRNDQHEILYFEKF